MKQIFAYEINIMTNLLNSVDEVCHQCSLSLYENLCFFLTGQMDIVIVKLSTSLMILLLIQEH